MAEYLKQHGLKVMAQMIATIPAGKRRPDFELRNSGVFFGEGEWQSNYREGMYQVIEYSDIPGSSGYFLIGYPDELRDKIRQKRLATVEPEALLSSKTYRAMFKVEGQPISLFQGALEEIPTWIRDAIEQKARREHPDEFINLIRDIVSGLTQYLPSAEAYPSFFEHIVAFLPKGKTEIETARQAAAYLLLNQIIFYRILSAGRGYPPIERQQMREPGDLTRVYFNRVLQDDYQAVFNFDVASLFPKSSFKFILDMIRIIEDLAPEYFTRDLLGNVFHRLIPQEVRKPVAAYYTNPMAARLLARLCVKSPSDKVADFACGSGTLLMAAYDRKTELLGHPIDEETHRRFIEEELTGADIMPFAAHLAVVQLALRNPGYLTDKVRIAVYDSTLLRPGTTIRSLERVMPHGQALIDTYISDIETERAKVGVGAVSGAGTGQGFAVNTVDVVMMNPPFTRKQHIKEDYRAMLTERFGDYRDYASKEMNFFVYFMLLADRFLREGGRLAMVLPASVLRQLSARGIRRLITQKYALEYIVHAGFRLAFSESTSFREILLVARKTENNSGSNPCIVARLDVMPSAGNIDLIAELLSGASESGIVGVALSDRARQAGIGMATERQETFRQDDNWQKLLFEEKIAGFSLPASPVLTPLKEASLRVVQGIRFHENSDRVDLKNTVLSMPREAATRVNWKIEGESATDVEALNVKTGMTVRIPKSVLRPSTRSASGMTTIEIREPLDYVVVGRFPGDEIFWDDPNPDAILKRRIPHLKSREAFLVAAGRNNVGLTSPGTHFLAFVAAEPIPPTWSFWAIKTQTLEEARILALWWNSTFQLVQLIENRAEVGGSWGGWLREDLERLPTLNPSQLTPEERQELLRVYGEWKFQPFPPLLEQLKAHYFGRLAIDSAVAKVIGGSFQEMRASTLHTLYDTIAEKLEKLGALSMRR